ncbi:hypothetical protein [Hydrogenophaga sp.]|uniref:hypothetical protein n=1 Tax=Hydrogenophaga sp. TaxID=1904254 RepID=UPI0027315351|nr:hypothetical protein [Hydrogenophaga sp.]MDP2074621.1 hypothetical protein [Hydrogenophaga sp.]MDP3106410.1 hypothetical protein [Hydrogenophaga sp.]
MMLILRPAGRGNWRTAQLSIQGDRAQPLLVRIGDKFELAGVTWRVVRILP